MNAEEMPVRHFVNLNSVQPWSHASTARQAREACGYCSLGLGKINLIRGYAENVSHEVSYIDMRNMI